MVGLYCCDQPLKDLLLFLSGLCLVLGSSQRRQFTWCQDLRTCQSGRSQSVPGVQIVECGAKDDSEKKVRRKRGKGREEGTPVRFVFKRSFGLFFRLVIRTQFPVLKVVNQVTGDKPHCELNFKKLCLYSSFIFVFCKRINPLLPKMKDLASIARNKPTRAYTYKRVSMGLTEWPKIQSMALKIEEFQPLAVNRIKRVKRKRNFPLDLLIVRKVLNSLMTGCVSYLAATLTLYARQAKHLFRTAGTLRGGRLKGNGKGILGACSCELACITGRY